MSSHLLLDGFNLTFRSFYAVPELTRSDGLPTNAIHGWVRTIWRLQDKYQPKGMRAFFDLEGSRRRLEILPEYKANRGETPDTLIPQIPWIKKITQAMGIPVIEVAGVEADDLLASHACALASQNEQVYMVSADKDLAQVVSENIYQLLPPPTANPRLGWREMDADAVKEKFAVSVAQIPDYLALIGDTSDNIPGLQGVGPKTAAKWLNAHQTLEGILENAATILPKRFQEKIPPAADRLRRNVDLIRLETDLKDSTELVFQPNVQELFEAMEALEMKSMAEDAKKRYLKD